MADTDGKRSRAASGDRPGSRTGARRRTVGIALVVGVTAMLAGSAWLNWVLWPRSARVFTDADSIHIAADGAPLRDILWQPPDRLPRPVNTPADDYEPRLTADGRSLFFVRGHAGDNADIYLSRRVDDVWTEPWPLASINTEYDELGPQPSADGSALYFYSDRPGGSGGYDIWVALRRDSDPLAYGEARNLGSAVNSTDDDYAPALTPDGQALWFSSNRPRAVATVGTSTNAIDSGTDNDANIGTDSDTASRTGTAQPRRSYDLYVAALSEVGPAQAVLSLVLSSDHNDAAPALSSVGDFLYFASDRPGGSGGFDLYRARLLDGHPQPPRRLGDSVNTAANELDPALALDGFSLFFSSDRAIAPNNDAVADYDLYRTSSREVFARLDWSRAKIDWAALWRRVGPNVLWALLALAILLAVFTLVGDMRRRQLSLLSRCLLASMMLHVLLLFLLNLWQVGMGLAESMNAGGKPVHVTLASAASADTIMSQVRGRLTDATTPAPTQPSLTAYDAPTTFDTGPRAVTVETPTRPIELPVRRLIRVTSALAAPAPSLPAPPMSQTIDRVDQTLPPALTVTPPQLRSIVKSHDTEARRAVRPVQAATASEMQATRKPADEADTTSPASAAFAQVQIDPKDQTAPPGATPSSTFVKVSSAQDSSAPPAAVGPTTDFAESSIALAPTSATTTSAIELPKMQEQRGPASVESPRVSVPKSVTDAAQQRQTSLLPSSTSGSGTYTLEPGASDRMASAPNGSNSSLLGAIDIDAAEASTVSPGPRPWDEAAKAIDLPGAFASDVSLPAMEEQAAVATADEGIEGSIPQPEAPGRTRAEATLGGTAISLAAVSPDSRRDVILDPTPSDRRMSKLSSLVAVSETAYDTSTTRSRSPVTRDLAADIPPADAKSLKLDLPDDFLAHEDPYAQRSAPNRQSYAKRKGATDETERAVALALKWLAAHQSEDGHWDGELFDQRCAARHQATACGGETKYSVDVALTGLALLSFLASDHTHDKEGPYQDTARNALDWLIAHQDSHGDLRRNETMYSQGIATIALAESYGMTGDTRLAEPVRRAVRFIERARNLDVGGWRYDPGQAGDTSVLGWQIMALKSARMAGLEVSWDAFDAARRWLDKVSTRSHPGYYAYQPGDRYTHSMTAEGMFVQQILGLDPDSKRMRQSARLVLDHLPDWSEKPNTYYWYYATLAMFQRQGDDWETWNESITRELLTHQRRDGNAAGSWDPDGEWAHVGGRVYQTAICALTLEVYYRYLPMYRSGQLAEGIGTIHGHVTDELTGEPIADAMVRLDLADRDSVIVTSNSHGEYRMHPPEMPEFVALSASHDAYVPTTVNVATALVMNSALALDFSLTPQSGLVVAVERDPRVHHLGDDRFEGRINSRFQREAEGSVYRARFTLSSATLGESVTDAKLVLMVKGVQMSHAIYINGQRLRRYLDDAPNDGSFGEFSAPVDPRLLRVGENTLKIRAESRGNDVDDFEFVNVQIHLTRGAEVESPE